MIEIKIPNARFPIEFTFIADTHMSHHELKLSPSKGVYSVLVHAGDGMGHGEYLIEVVDMARWLTRQGFNEVIYIAGNHDLLFERGTEAKEIMEQEGVVYLEDSMAVVGGVIMWGSPVTPPFMNWAFMREPERIKNHWNAIRPDTDILVTHGPPRGILDMGNKGCPILLDTVMNRVKPKIHAFGHIHGGAGQYLNFDPATLFINASVLNEDYAVANPHTVVMVVPSKD